MKKILKQTRSFYWILSVLMVFGIASCRKDTVQTGGKGAPKVTRVRYLSKTDTIENVSHPVNLDSANVYNDIKVVPFDSTVVAGRLNTQYAIVGENLLSTTKVLVNGKQVYFNPALVTDNIVIFTVSADVPFGPTQTNKLTVVTTQGTVDYDFGILQPPPVITSFTPLAAGAGDIVTITGSVLAGATVKFDDTPATVIGTPTDTEVKVQVPAGIVQAYLYVTTSGGTSKSAAAFGFKSVLYDEALQNGWGNYDGYGSTRNFKDTQHPKRGLYAIATTVDNGYGALQIGYGGATLNAKTKGFTALKFSIYGGAGIKDGDKVRVVINGGYGDGVSVVVTMKAGVYTDYTIPLSQLGDPGNINEFVMQTQGTAAPATFYVDDIGFI
ncbi:IPT/TIG domain-containing protein [Mucilaginibacter gilvus]|uniref:Uncharacterized protein n=1 Tax=Mucilaginibacter gilvus TaxID=2305909 RepID=A0A3S3UVY7_9SPHI|nr:IPT/TIG domain-containing protein [Mucilaginibacter gilvus]RWY55817.1 hypothetical protein EPL05_05440 [Mucilaginibacter gilvus]